MADAQKEVQIRLTAKDETKGAFESAGNNVKQATTSWKGMALAVATGQAAFTLAAGAVKSMAGFLQDCTREAIDNTRAQASIDQMVKNSGVDFAKASDAINKQSNAFVKLGFAGTDTAEAMGRFISITKDTEKSTKMMTLAADLARAKNMDLATATDALQRVLLNGGAAAKKLGVDIDASATSTEALDAIMKQFGGTAKSFAQSTAGSVQVASTAWAELKETLGGQFLKVVNEVYGAMGRLASDERVTGYLVTLTGLVSDRLVAAIDGMIKIFDSFTNGTSPAVTTALSYLTAAYDALKAIVTGVWEWIGKVMNQLQQVGIIDHFKEKWAEIVALYETELRPSVERLQKSLEPYMPLLTKLAELIGTVLVAAIILALEGLAKFLEMWIKTATAINNIATSVFNFFAPAIETVKSSIQGVISFIDNLIAKFTAAADAARRAADAVRNFLGGSGGANVDMGGPPTSITGSGTVKLAAGGIVTRPTMALVGEAGPEAVIPLSKAGSVGATINVMQGASISVSGQGDERRLARTVASEIARTLQAQRLGLATQL